MEYIQRKIEEDPSIDVKAKVKVWQFRNHQDADIGEIVDRMGNCYLVDEEQKSRGITQIIVYEASKTNKGFLAGNLFIENDEVQVIEPNEEDNKKIHKFIKAVKNGTLLKVGSLLYKVSLLVDKVLFLTCSATRKLCKMAKSANRTK